MRSNLFLFAALACGAWLAAGRCPAADRGPPAGTWVSWHTIADRRPGRGDWWGHVAPHTDEDAFRHRVRPLERGRAGARRPWCQ